MKQKKNAKNKGFPIFAFLYEQIDSIKGYLLCIILRLQTWPSCVADRHSDPCRQLHDS